MEKRQPGTAGIPAGQKGKPGKGPEGKAEWSLWTAAEKAGIKAGDLIVAFDGEDVTTMDKLNELKNKHNIGDEVKIKLIRNGEGKAVSITLGENKSTNEQ